MIRTFLSTSVLLALLLGGCILVPGCGALEGITVAKPETRASFDPVNHSFTFSDSKDNDVDVEGFEVKTASGTAGVIKKFTIRNNASDVRRANEPQLLGMAALATANWQGAAQTIGAVGGALAEVMPFVPQSIAARALGKLRGGQSVQTPWGGYTSAGLPDAQLDGLMKIAGSAATKPGG